MSEQRDQPASERSLVERLVAPDDDVDGIGRPLSRRALQTARTLEGYLEAGNQPRWMQRLAEIHQGMRRELRRLEHAHRTLEQECAGRPGDFRRRWREIAQGWDFRALNELVTQHNEWYPIERRLAVDLRTRDYVLMHGRSHRREHLGPAWILERFPDEPPAAAD